MQGHISIYAQNIHKDGAKSEKVSNDYGKAYTKLSTMSNDKVKMGRSRFGDRLSNTPTHETFKLRDSYVSLVSSSWKFWRGKAASNCMQPNRFLIGFRTMTDSVGLNKNSQRALRAAHRVGGSTQGPPKVFKNPRRGVREVHRIMPQLEGIR